MHYISSFIATPHGILINELPLSKAATHLLSSESLRHINRASELLKAVKPEEWENRMPHHMNHVPTLAKVNMLLALAQPLNAQFKLLAKAGFNPDQSRDAHGMWTDAGGVDGEDGGSDAPSINTSRQNSQTNMDAAIQHLEDNAEDSSKNRCAQYVRDALNAGGFDVQLPDNSDSVKQAKDYGQPLMDAGFTPVVTASQSLENTYPPADYTPQAGDVAVIQPYQGGNQSGHMAMYTGTQWVSDFVQQDMWGGKIRRTIAPSYVIYRHPKN